MALNIISWELNMKRLFEKLFKKEPAFSYTVADYKPFKKDYLHNDVTVTEYQIDRPTETDEMTIDKIYQQL